MAAGLVVTMVVIAARRDIAYSLVIVWALAGIAVKQSLYPNIVLTVEVAIVVVLIVLAFSILFYRLRHKNVK